MPAINPDEVEAHRRESLAPFDPPEGENPYAIHEDLRTMMQSVVGIVRTEEDLKIALEGARRGCAPGPARSRWAATSSTTPAGTWRST